MNFLSKKYYKNLIKSNILYYKFFILLIFGIMFFTFAYADFTSTNFQLENPINIIEGGQATSTNFQYFSTTGQLIGGQSTSTNFAQNAGFMYFPTATSPIVTATAGNAQVVLTWTTAVGIFANITSYDVGISTSSGGTFAYTTVGDVSTSTRTSLTNSTSYYFKIRSYAAGILLSESAEVNVTPVSSENNNNVGGGGSGFASTTGVIFSGRAYPLSKVNILKDGQLVLTTIAGPDSKFTATLGNLSAGNYTFSVYGEDKDGLRSSSFSFQIFITSGVTTNVGSIFITPTISVNKSEVKRGDNIIIFGQSSPLSSIVININSPQEFFKNTSSDASGAYLYNLDTSILEFGRHSSKSKALKNGEISSFSGAVGFLVGTKNVFTNITEKVSKGDFNGDNRSNLVDFSIAAFWYKKKDPPTKIDLNNDGIVNLTDFSIMAYYWTG